MIRLIDRATGEVLGEAGLADFRVLRSTLQDEDLLDTDYYLNAPTLDLLQEGGLGAPILEVLRRALGEQEGIDVGWERAGGGDPRSVSGRILSEVDGRPLPGLKVEAYDGDLSTDRFLGWAFTRADGGFQVDFGGEHPEDLEVGWTPEQDPEVRLQVAALDGTVLLQTEPREMGAATRLFGDLRVPEPPPLEEEEPLEEEAGEPPDPALLPLDRPLEHPLGETGGVEGHLEDEETA